MSSITCISRAVSFSALPSIINEFSEHLSSFFSPSTHAIGSDRQLGNVVIGCNRNDPSYEGVADEGMTGGKSRNETQEKPSSSIIGFIPDPSESSDSTTCPFRKPRDDHSLHRHATPSGVIVSVSHFLFPDPCMCRLAGWRIQSGDWPTAYCSTVRSFLVRNGGFFCAAAGREP